MTLVIFCVLALTIGRHLYGGLSIALAAPASGGFAIGSSTVSSSPHGRPVDIGPLEDPLIVESSGLVASRTTPGSFWTHNDSGPYDPYLFCVRADASSCGRWTIPGASATDWEDIAAGPGPVAGVSYLYVGDIGDNARQRSSVMVYVVEEPKVADDAGLSTTTTTSVPSTIELTYPDGAHDAETLLVHPRSGDLYIVTKERNSRSRVYKASAPLGPRVQMAKIATFRIFDNFSERTGGDISPDASRVVFSTYLGAYEKRAYGGDFDSIWKAPAIPIDMGAIKQREAIAYSLDGNGLFSTSEGAGAHLVKVTRK